MTTLAEIMSSPSALDKAADDFANFYAQQARNNGDMNNGIATDNDFIHMMDTCGNNTSIDYKKFCGIGVND